ncbi:UDP-N-acetylmuramate dehydrogenase [Buchnera aphidicola]|uniref:UDP-N-acetylenolpyruvoylglucosamine reductase n=1 Tax=Buchnera aphidicola subsp. Uroleucon sonchi TaxID=118118 RepID=A0A6C1FAA4_BUCUN|nr:UDP-N-acetylmuramate dehydrogenase [Buchnera aphidicola]QIE01808.1 UDP-N-acetylmuramate dehydrogenase [Buchnera aphidicola (Uroleucon sonchi)]
MYKNKYSCNQSLKNLNTFAIDITAKKIVFVKTIAQLIAISKKCKLYNIPYIILGEASNILFLKNYKGVVIFNRIKGIKIVEQDDSWLLHVNSGEKWHHLVKLTVNLGIFGLENLALIPGCIGSAAIQNIGAYGLEFKDICQYVEIISLKNRSKMKIYNRFCLFSYRNSIFKHKYNHEYAIIKVGIKILKNWKPIILSSIKNYIQTKHVNGHQIFNIICKIRKNKLPDPKKTGNAGSFFKNPIITKKKLQTLVPFYRKIPYFLEKNGLIKISAGWLIEKYQFNNIQIGDATIYQKQKLILINKNNATPQDIIQLARIIYSCILKKFNIALEPEIDFIGPVGKIKSSEILK